MHVAPNKPANKKAEIMRTMKKLDYSCDSNVPLSRRDGASNRWNGARSKGLARLSALARLGELRKNFARRYFPVPVMRKLNEKRAPGNHPF